jgi:DNA-binding MarR family transcriptional regulator
MDRNVPRKRDEDTGQYTETATDDEILEFLAENDGAGTGDVADRFDYEQPSAYRRLKRLEEEGRVRSRRIGGSLLWTIVEEDATDE